MPYLGSLITDDGECTTEFRTKLNRAQAIGESLRNIWKSHVSIPISTKMRLMKALLWPVAAYGCESRDERTEKGSAGFMDSNRYKIVIKTLLFYLD